MSHPFPSRSGLIIVRAEVSGPAGRINAELALDTGATTSIIDDKILRAAGHDPDASSDHTSVMTGAGKVAAPRLMINRLTALGRHAIGLRVLSHALPADAEVDGLLGLDFFRGLALTIDFRAGRITLA